jgi:hypothetical protein
MVGNMFPGSGGQGGVLASGRHIVQGQAEIPEGPKTPTMDFPASCSLIHVTSVEHLMLVGLGQEPLTCTIALNGTGVGGSSLLLLVFVFFCVVLGFELRAFTLSHSTSSFL